MERDCAMCHSLAFARVDGTIRTLRHGDPAQVIADLRDFYRLRIAPLPPSLSPLARRMPGSIPHSREQIQFDYGARMPTADAAIRAVFSPGGACYDCHTIDAPAVRRLFRDGVELTLSGRNLWVWTNYSGYDPEINLFGTNAGGLGSLQTTAADRGFDFGGYPIPRVWSLGARFTF